MPPQATAREHTIPSYLDQNEAIEARGRALADAATREQLTWKPAPERWSIAEVFEHLNITLAGYLERLRPAVRSLQEAGHRHPGPFRYGWFERWFEGSLEPPAKRRFKAPGAFQPATPASQLSPEEVFANFHQQRQELAEILRTAEGLDLRRAKITSPALSLIRFRIGAAVAITLAHDRRHLEQAEQVLAELPD